MVPLVGAVEELRLAREEVTPVLAEVGEDTGLPGHGRRRASRTHGWP
ncbi:hypothetical protein KBP30_39145 [Streptomyces sp. Go40/10]|nr:hypothetical protein [Streptomyces sp. Go40/10]UFR07666.1 hypothetical protein KBP30_39145 [Streptomyces sp. Go40/10]